MSSLVENKCVLICDKFEPEGIEMLKQVGFKIIEMPMIEADKLETAIAKANIVIVRSRTKITKDMLDKAGQLDVIARPGTGVDNIDLKAAADRGIPVFTSVEASTNAVAELTIALAINLARSITLADAAMKNDRWIKDSLMGIEMREKQFGIIGLGRIGKRVAHLANALEMTVVAFEKEVVKPEVLLDLNIKQIDLEDLLRTSDFVTLHLPAGPDTINLIGKEQLKMMKKTAFLINTARGQLVVEDDLHHALVNGWIRGAALDVFVTEPPVGNKLLSLSNLISTPHIGAQIIEAQKQASIQLATKIIEYFTEKSDTRDGKRTI